VAQGKEESKRKQNKGVFSYLNEIAKQKGKVGSSAYAL